MYADVLFPRPLDQPFRYRIPEAFPPLTIGAPVLVPLGRRTARGYVVGFSEAPPASDAKAAIAPLSDPPPLDPQMVEFTRWVASYYLAPWGELLRAALPPERARARTRPVLRLSIPFRDLKRELEELAARAPRQAGLLRALIAAGVDGYAPSPNESAAATALIRRGWVEREHQPLERIPPVLLAPPASPEKINAVQEEALDAIGAAIALPRFAVFLLHGVTGSGKTEVYLRSAAAALAAGRSVLLLTPEISLAAPLVSAARDRLGQTVALLHSALSDGERRDAWYRLRRGEARVVVGARSALFAPLQNLGLIVVDEEHDGAYKQEQGPRYQARDMAIVRARLTGIPAVLGSATPSLESYRNARSERYHLLRFPERVDGRPMPSVRVVALGGRDPATGLLTPELLGAIRERLQRGEQTLLFLNRRGFAPTLLCRECGHVVLCPDCSVALTYHKAERVLRCHYCGERRSMPGICPGCRGTGLTLLGLGTERLDEAVRAAIPEARVARMDRDTMGRRHAHERVLGAMAAGKLDVLIGTQMIAKGLDLPRVTLVGVVCADVGLFLPDFRAAERTFQLLVQVIGRCGRADRPGEAIVQTYNPRHDCIQRAVRQEYEAFYEAEVAQRRALRYPPWTGLTLLLVRAKEPERAARAAAALGERLRRELKDVTLIGPAPAPLPRLRGMSRWQLLLKTTGRRPSPELAEAIRRAGREGLLKGVEAVIDVDPYNLL